MVNNNKTYRMKCCKCKNVTKNEQYVTIWVNHYGNPTRVICKICIENGAKVEVEA